MSQDASVLLSVVPSQTCTLELWGFPIFKVWTGIYDHCSMQCTMQAPQQYTAAAAAAVTAHYVQGWH